MSWVEGRGGRDALGVDLTTKVFEIRGRGLLVGVEGRE